MAFLIRLIVNAAALWVATRLVSGVTYVGGWAPFFGVALVFGFVNAFIRPVAKYPRVPRDHFDARSLLAGRQRADAVADEQPIGYPGAGLSRGWLLAGVLGRTRRQHRQHLAVDDGQRGRVQDIELRAEGSGLRAQGL